MGGGVESPCVGRVYGADVAVPQVSKNYLPCFSLTFAVHTKKQFTCI